MSPEGNSDHPNRGGDGLGIDEIAHIATEVALAEGGHIPTLVVEGSGGTAICQLTEFPGDQKEKHQSMAITGFMAAQKREVGSLKQVSFVSEGWMSLAREGQPPSMVPSQDPNRREVLVVHRLDVKSKKATLVLFEMIRDGEGQLTDLARMNPEGEAGVGGDEEASAESPLLDAFVAGFLLGKVDKGRKKRGKRR